MKKVFLSIVLIIILSFTFIGCSSPELPGVAWASAEILTYDIFDGESCVGNLTVTNVRDTIGDKFSNKLNGYTFNTADSRVTIDLKLTDKMESTTTMLVNNVSPIALSKTYTDLVDPSKSYKVEGSQDKKNYKVSVNGAESEKLNVGTTGYSYGEYIYHLIRSYSVGSQPSTIKVADPLNDTVHTVAIGASDTEILKVADYNGTKDKQVACQKFVISLSNTPAGTAMVAWFAVDNSSNNLYVNPNGGLSKRIPVKMSENNLEYRLTKVAVGFSI